MSVWCARYKVQICANCLMPDRVNLIAVPETKVEIKPKKPGPKSSLPSFFRATSSRIVTIALFADRHEHSF